MDKYNAGIEARDWFSSHGEDFVACLLRCLFHGWIFRCGDFFLLAHEVFVSEKGQIIDVLEGPKNCWFLDYLGHKRGEYSPVDYMDYAPWPHSFVAYKRRGKIVVRKWERLRRDFNVRKPRREIQIYARG